MSAIESAADFSQLTAVVSSANRPKSLRRLVQSLRGQLPDVKILVADASREVQVPKGVDLVKVPTGVGRASGCNALLSRVRTPYFLLVDDRVELGRETQVERLLQLVAEDKLDVAAGDLVGCRRNFWFFVKRQSEPGHGMLEFSGDALTLLSGHRAEGEGYLWCDLVHNFFVARTDKVRNLGGWDPELENDEREEFFVRAHRQGLRVGLDPGVVASVWEESATADEPTVDRKSLAVAKMGLVRMTDFEGRVVKAPRRAMAA